MNQLKDFFLERLSRYMQRKGIGLSIDNFSFKKRISLKGVDINAYRENVIIGIMHLKIRIMPLLRRKMVVRMICENITVMPGNLCETKLSLARSETDMLYDKRKKDFSINTILDDAITLSFKIIKNAGEKEFFMKADHLSIDKYKQMLDGHIISSFMKSIYSNSPISILCYYKHDQTSPYPKLSTTFQYDSLKIHPGYCTLSKEYLIDELSKRKHLAKEYKPLEQIPEIIRRTIICTEDPSFEQHKGISPILTGITIRSNINQKALKRGGSTISMQLVKNALLNGERTFTRKAEEAILTLLMENHYLVSKQDILEVYLNMIEFAPNIYGIEDASLFYFGKTSSLLNIVEVIVLTYIIPRPQHFYEALLQKTELLRGNLHRHVTQYLDVALRKKIVTPDEVQSIDTGTILFADTFGILSIEP